MTLVNKTIQLPKDMLDAFEKNVSREKQGALLATLIQNWLDEQARAALRAHVIEGCEYMADVALEDERAFNAADEELHRAIEY